MKVLFLDRDGVINVDKGYVSNYNDFEFNNSIFDLCLKFQELGYNIIEVTNQTGIGMNKYSLEDFFDVNNKMLDEFKKRNINFLDVFYCPHNPNDNCSCRKPKPGMILEAQKKYNIDLSQSLLIGDKITDAKAANNAGIKKIYLINYKGEKPDFDVIYINDLKEVEP